MSSGTALKCDQNSWYIQIHDCNTNYHRIGLVHASIVLDLQSLSIYQTDICATDTEMTLEFGMLIPAFCNWNTGL
jgi:hypothetical protein